MVMYNPSAASFDSDDYQFYKVRDSAAEVKQFFDKLLARTIYELKDTGKMVDQMREFKLVALYEQFDGHNKVDAFAEDDFDFMQQKVQFEHLQYLTAQMEYLSTLEGFNFAQFANMLQMYLKVQTDCKIPADELAARQISPKRDLRREAYPFKPDTAYQMIEAFVKDDDAIAIGHESYNKKVGPIGVNDSSALISNSKQSVKSESVNPSEIQSKLDALQKELMETNPCCVKIKCMCKPEVREAAIQKYQKEMAEKNTQDNDIENPINLDDKDF